MTQGCLAKCQIYMYIKLGYFIGDFKTQFAVLIVNNPNFRAGFKADNCVYL